MGGPLAILVVGLVGSFLEPLRPWTANITLILGLAGGLLYLHRARIAPSLIPGLLVWGLAGLIQVFPIPALESYTPQHWLGVAGSLLLAFGLLPLEDNSRPRFGLWLLLPMTAFLGLVLLEGTNLMLWLAYGIGSLFLLYALAHPVETLLKGQAPAARMVWLSGILVVQGLALMQWNQPDLSKDNQHLLLTMMGAALLLVGWGVWLEARDRFAPLLLEGIALAVLMLGWVVVIKIENPALQEGTLLAGSFAFLACLGILTSNHSRRAQAETRTQHWIGLLESLYNVTPVNQTISPQTVLKEIMASLQPLFPNMVGLALHGDQTVLSGKQTIHDHLIELGENSEVTLWLYFERRTANLRELESVEPLIVKRLRQILAVRELRSQVFSDPLTGLLNRRGMEQQLPRLIEGAQRNRQAITVAMLDMDHFKRINDTYGHPVGDVALRTMAEVLRRHLRAGDIAVRWGGEEFALILYGAQLADAEAVLDRVQSEMRGRKVATIAWPITLSAGVCGGQIPPGKTDLEDWFHQADIALLQAKERGRNRVEVAKLGLPGGKSRK